MPSPRTTPDILVLFDVDGTLVHTGGAGRRALARVFDELFGVPDAFAGYAFTGRTDQRILRDAFSRWFQRAPQDGELEQARAGYLERLVEELDSGRDQVKVLPGVRALLDRLAKAGVPPGLATGNLEDGARLKLGTVDLWEPFAFGGFGSDAEHRGELTRIGIERGCRLVGHEVPPERIFVVGDSPLDVEAARYAGVRAVGVMTGWSPRQEMVSSRPDALLEDLSDLESVWRILGGA